MSAKQRVVVIGGGTGTYTLLRGLRAYEETLHITAVVTMADSGGSTGRLRDEFGQLPVGDVRQALAALAPGHDEYGELLRTLFLYRFEKGEGLSGHNFGNLFLTALTDILGSEALAIEAAGRLLRIAGEVVPVTTDNVHLVARYNTGDEVVGEHAIDEASGVSPDARITTLSLSGGAQVTERVCSAIVSADLIVYGPGDLYTSILPNLIVGGMRECLADSMATTVFVANLMSRRGQTQGMHLTEYLLELERYSGRLPHTVIVPDASLPAALVAHYGTTEGVHPLSYETTLPVQLWREPIVDSRVVLPVAGDTVQRSFLRHDSVALAAAVYRVLHSSVS